MPNVENAEDLCAVAVKYAETAKGMRAKVMEGLTLLAASDVASIKALGLVWSTVDDGSGDLAEVQFGTIRGRFRLNVHAFANDRGHAYSGEVELVRWNPKSRTWEAGSQVYINGRGTLSTAPHGQDLSGFAWDNPVHLASLMLTPLAAPPRKALGGSSDTRKS